MIQVWGKNLNGKGEEGGGEKKRKEQGGRGHRQKRLSWKI